MFEPAENVRPQAGRGRTPGRQERAARAVPLLALRRGPPAPDQPQPVPVELERGLGKVRGLIPRRPGPRPPTRAARAAAG